MQAPKLKSSVTSRRFWSFALLAGMLPLALGLLEAAPPEAEKPVTEPELDAHVDAALFMRAKLAAAQAVLEGLVTEDFALIRKGARQMKTMSEAAQWPRSPDKVYDHHSEQFRRLAAKLEHLAQKENLEGASFTHMHVTSVCIECHNYVRNRLRVAEDPEGEHGGVLLIPSEWPEH